MPKVELNNVSSGYNLATINSNFEKIETALNDSVLFRDDVGANPNSMSVDLDMNNQRIFNLPAPVLNNEPLRKGDIGDLEGSIASIEANKIAAEYAAEIATGAVSSIGTSVSDAAAYAAAAESSSRLTVGTVTTGSPGSSASVSITGTPGTQAISFTIPRGDVGPQGIQGATGATGPQGVQGEIGPQGPQGIQGIQGPQGLPGTGAGDVVGPASSTDNTIPRFDGTTGKLLQGSGVTVDDSGNLIIGTGAVREKQSAIAASNIDLATGNVFTKTVSGATTFTVSNVAPSGNVSSFILDLTNGGSATVTWWANVKWAGGTAPTLTAAGRDVLGFFTHDGGTTWTGLMVAKDAK